MGFTGPLQSKGVPDHGLKDVFTACGIGGEIPLEAFERRLGPLVHNLTVDEKMGLGHRARVPVVESHKHL
jgi:hypothetical protein